MKQRHGDLRGNAATTPKQCRGETSITAIDCCFDTKKVPSMMHQRVGHGETGAQGKRGGYPAMAQTTPVWCWDSAMGHIGLTPQFISSATGSR